MLLTMAVSRTSVLPSALHWRTTMAEVATPPKNRIATDPCNTFTSAVLEEDIQYGFEGVRF